MRWIRHFLPFITKTHRWVYQRTGGRIGGWIPLFGFRFLMLEHVGRKTGLPRQTPLLYVADGDDLLIVASNAGHDHDPAWWLNLQAKPETRVRVGPTHGPVRARVASAEETDVLWPTLTKSWPWFDEYRAGTEREIPIVILEPAIPREQWEGAGTRQRVEVTRRFDAKPEDVWAIYTDHARWREWAGTPGSRLIREGEPDRDGTGAVRAFVGGMREEVLSFDAPKRMTYRVVAGALPVKNHCGEVCLEPDGAGTRIVWRCEFEPKLPGTGGLLRRFITFFFSNSLRGLEKRGFAPPAD